MFTFLKMKPTSSSFETRHSKLCSCCLEIRSIVPRILSPFPLSGVEMIHLHRILLGGGKKQKMNWTPCRKSQLRKAMRMIFILILLSCSLSSLLLAVLPYLDIDRVKLLDHRFPEVNCSSLIDGSLDTNTTGLCCDRSHFRTDVCYMKGDVRTVPRSNSIHLYGSQFGSARQEKLKPYTRKWEKGIMSTVDEMKLQTTHIAHNLNHSCDVVHAVPGVVFSTGGYTGNVYHEFNDGWIPLYITTERFSGDVVFLILEYHGWWMQRYSPLIQRLSKHEVVDLRRDKRTHCFSELIVGLKIHDELSINPGLMNSGKGMHDFQAVLSEAFSPGIIDRRRRRPRLTILARKKTRILLNLKEIVRMARKDLGLEVELLFLARNTELATIHKALQSTEVLFGVHGAELTHLLFMRPGSVLIQIIPLGLDWPAETYYGEPAKKIGLKYMEYGIRIKESSLYGKYNRTDPVLVRPESVNQKGWWETKRVYMSQQNVHADLKRLRRFLAEARSHVLALPRRYSRAK